MTEHLAAPVTSGEVRRIVELGDTVWDLAVAVYGFCDGGIVERVAAASNLEDPNLIYVGQTLVFPPLPVEPAGPAAATPSLPPGAATWSTHTVVAGDTLWDILDTFYGYVDADLVWSYARWAGLPDPSDIAVGTVLTMPPVEVLTGAARTQPTACAGTTPPPPEATAPAASAEPPETPVEEAAPPVEDRAALPDGRGADGGAARACDAVRSVAVTAAGRGVGGHGQRLVAAVLPPWMAGLAGATTLSVGLLAVYRRLRRRQGRPERGRGG